MASHACRTIWKLQSIQLRSISASCQHFSTSVQTRTAAEESTVADSQNGEIVIPAYIERSPTDILKALSSTVGHDPTAAHYKFHDDPYLMPASNPDKRQYSLSQESGRQSARWIRDTHPHLFQHQTAQPFSQVFAPVPMYDENSTVDETVLQQLIEQIRVTDAIAVYQRLVADNSELSRETHQSLLELVCYYNAEDTLSEDRIEERWFSSTGATGKTRKTWKDNGVAEQVFRRLERPDARAYCTVIKGMAKYYQADRAMQLWNEMLNLGLPPDLDTYDHLISIASFVMESSEKQWEFVEGLLRQMAQQGLRPRPSTLTAVLQAVRSTGAWRRAQEVALATWREFRDLGVQPSLASYYCLLTIFYRERAPNTTLLRSMMDELQGKTFTIQHPMDTYFFATAMDICRHKLQDSDLALRLDQLLHTGNNYDLMGDWHRESVYYRHLLAVMYNTQPIHQFMVDFYDKLVPNIYTPEPGIMEGLVRQVNLSGAVELMPRLWADMVAFSHMRRESLVETVLRTLALNPTDQPELCQQLADVAWSVFETVEAHRTRSTEPVHWTATRLGDVMLVLSRAGQVARAARVLRKLDREQTDIVGVPDAVSLQALFDVAMANRETSVCTLCVRYSADMGFSEARSMCASLLETLPVGEQDRLALSATGLDVPLAAS